MIFLSPADACSVPASQQRYPKHGVVGSLAAAKPAQEKGSAAPAEPTRLCFSPREQAASPIDTAKSIGKTAAHNSAVLLCRLRCTSRADQVVLHPERRWSALLLPRSRHKRTALPCVPPREQAASPIDTAKSIGKTAAHNSAVLLCRLRGSSRADQVVLRSEKIPFLMKNNHAIFCS